MAYLVDNIFPIIFAWKKVEHVLFRDSNKIDESLLSCPLFVRFASVLESRDYYRMISLVAMTSVQNDPTTDTIKYDATLFNNLRPK